MEKELCGDCFHPVKWVKAVPNDWLDRAFFRECWCGSFPLRFPEIEYTGGGMCCPLCGTTECGGCDVRV
jgi:hypothetical protein